MSKEEIINLLNMGLSPDIESQKLFLSLLETEFPYIITWDEFTGRFRSNWYSSDIISYVFFIRRHFFPDIVYSTYSDRFVS